MSIQIVIIGNKVIVNEAFKLGELLEDRGCRLTDVSCGDKLMFRPIKKRSYSNAHKSPLTVKCIQRCSCRNSNHIEKNGKCIRQMDTMKDGKANKVKMFLIIFLLIRKIHL